MRITSGFMTSFRQVAAGNSCNGAERLSGPSDSLSSTDLYGSETSENIAAGQVLSDIRRSGEGRLGSDGRFDRTPCRLRYVVCRLPGWRPGSSRQCSCKNNYLPHLVEGCRDHDLTVDDLPSAENRRPIRYHSCASSRSDGCFCAVRIGVSG